MDSIVLKDCTYRYPTSKSTSLNHVSLTVKAGELCAVIGANGSGKTTLLNVMRGFVPKFYGGDFSGGVFVDGGDIREKNLGELAVTMGYVFQNPFTQISGNADTVFEEVAYGLENLGVPPARIIERVNETLNLLKIEHIKDRNPFDLSGGQQQRVAFASIIAMNPDIYIIDEPTSQLDPKGTEEIFEIIGMMKKQGKTIVLVEHKMELIANFADHVVLLEKGAVVLDGSAGEILSDVRIKTAGAAMSKFAELGLALKDSGAPMPGIPVSEKEALEMIGLVLKRKIAT